MVKAYILHIYDIHFHATTLTHVILPSYIGTCERKHTTKNLRSFDQFSNMVIDDTSERRMCFKDQVCYYADVPLGLYVVRGDSMVLLGQVGDFIPNQLKEVKLEELVHMIAESGAGALNWDVDADLQA